MTAAQAINHPDQWATGLHIAFSALNRKKVARATDAADVLRVALRHNLRQHNSDHRHRSRIDPERTLSNTVLLGPSCPEDGTTQALEAFARHKVNLPARIDGVIAFEVVIQPPPGADVPAFWAEALRWLHATYEQPLSAVVHRDQSRPHMHAVVLALQGGRLAGRELQRGEYGFPALRRSFLNHVRDTLGLRTDRPMRSLADIAASPGKGPRSRAEAARRDVEALRRSVPAGEWGSVSAGAMSIPMHEQAMSRIAAQRPASPADTADRLDRVHLLVAQTAPKSDIPSAPMPACPKPLQRARSTAERLAQLAALFARCRAPMAPCPAPDCLPAGAISRAPQQHAATATLQPTSPSVVAPAEPDPRFLVPFAPAVGLLMAAPVRGYAVH
ncbi:MAG: hypothetical protein AB9M53_09840 [Leptothrix sp. (in: b-proteobacteria)]